jgi:hypothetical protein
MDSVNVGVGIEFLSQNEAQRQRMKSRSQPSK